MNSHICVLKRAANTHKHTYSPTRSGDEETIPCNALKDLNETYVQRVPSLLRGYTVHREVHKYSIIIIRAANNKWRYARSMHGMAWHAPIKLDSRPISFTPSASIYLWCGFSNFFFFFILLFRSSLSYYVYLHIVFARFAAIVMLPQSIVEKCVVKRVIRHRL